MAYSVDYRKRALEYMEEGHTYEELYESFKIYPSRIAEWRELLEKTGELKPQYRKTRKGKIDKTKLAEVLERKPDIYQSELAKMFNCSEQAISKALKKQKITGKKNNIRTPNNPM